jgi:hypothetical protein
VTVESAPAGARSNQPIDIHVRIANTGTVPWRAKSDNGIGHVRVGLQLLDAESRMIDRDFARAELPRDVAPGESVQVAIAGRAPVSPGDYELKCDLVAEGVTWFEPGGSAVAVTRLRVIAGGSGDQE